MSTHAAPLTPDLETFLAPVFERKPAGITAIDVRDLTSYTDTIVIVEGTSRRQVTSLAEHLIRRLKDRQIKPMGMEGIKEGEWALLDYGDIVIHLFESGAREFYNLEGLWADAPRIDLDRSNTAAGSGI